MALIDQGLVSGTNFFSAYLIATLCAKEEFGLYALIVAIITLLMCVQTSLVGLPMAVLGPSKAGDVLRKYLGSSGLLALCLALAVAGPALAGAALGWPSGGDGLRRAALPIAAALICLQIKEFYRRVLFVELLAGKVLALDAIASVLQVAGMLMLWLGGSGSLVPPVPGQLSAYWALVMIGASSLLAAIAGAMLSRGRIALRSSWSEHKEAWRENWTLGKWILGAQMGWVVAAHANTLVVAGVSGLAGAAAFEAPRLLLAPLQVLAFGGGNILAPRAAKVLSEGGAPALLRFMRPVTLVWSVIFVVYGLLVAAAPGQWLRLLYGSKYAGLETTVLLWSGFYVLSGLATIPCIILTVLHSTRLLLFIVVLGGVVMLVLSAWLCEFMGPIGGVAARLALQIVILISTSVIAAAKLRGGAVDGSSLECERTAGASRTWGQE